MGPLLVVEPGEHRQVHLSRGQLGVVFGTALKGAALGNATTV